MRSPAFRSLIVLAALLAAIPAAEATTIAPLRFDEVVRQAGIVVQGTVTDLQVRSTGAALTPAPESAAPTAPGAPVGVGVEGGRTLFTEITLRVEDQIGGTLGPEVRFTMAGGSSEDATVVVFGMPQFKVGERYMLLLRPDYERTNVPIVGVFQGYFRITADPATGKERLLNADGDIVLGIEGDRVALRHNPESARARTPQPGPAPTPEAEGAGSQTTPQVERYWASAETPMLPGAFLDAVRAMKEDVR